MPTGVVTETRLAKVSNTLTHCSRDPGARRRLDGRTRVWARGAGAFSKKSRGPGELRSTQVCATCSLREGRKAQPKGMARH
jgi:hypothetical protein